MSFPQLFSGGSLAEFVEQYYLKVPYALAGGCRDFLHFGSREVIERVLAQDAVDAIASSAEGSQRLVTPITRDKIPGSLASGHSLGIRHGHKHDAALAALATEFETFFSAPVDIHLYMTPANSAGFGWHYDAEDVFVLQTVGTKLWELRKNTVNPWPLMESLPDDMRYNAEIMPLVRCTLQMGDWLYIPAGYWHRTKALEESVSLSIGVASRTGIDAFDFVRQQLLESLRWRQRLSQLVGSHGESAASTDVNSLCEHFRELGQDLARIFSAESTAKSFLNYCRRAGSPQPTSTSHRDNELTTATSN